MSVDEIDTILLARKRSLMPNFTVKLLTNDRDKQEYEILKFVKS